MKEENHRGPSWFSIIIIVPLLTILTLYGVNLIKYSDLPKEYPVLQSFFQPGVEESVSEVKEVVRFKENFSVIENNWIETFDKVSSSVVRVSFIQNNEDTGATGTGFRVSEKVILSNWHIFSKAEFGDEVDIIINDGLLRKGVYVGADPKNDVAVIRIDEELPEVGIAILGDSSEVRVGEPVMIIGNPLTFDKTVNIGTVSFIDRPIMTGKNPEESLMLKEYFDNEVSLANTIQVDANINSGNSGSPLFNLNGEVIGLVFSSSNAPGGGEDLPQGMTFAIPINNVKNKIETMINEGYYPNSSLGVKGNTVIIEENGGMKSFQIIEILPESSAALGGLEKYDVITKINNIEITSTEILFGELNKYSPGEVISMEILRNDSLMNLDITMI